MRELALAGRRLGEGQPCLVAAHVGWSHEGSAEAALRLIDAAFQAGADAIVFSLFRSAELVVHRHPERRAFEQLELKEPSWRRVLEAARASGLAVIAEALDLPSRDLALEASVCALQSHPADVDHPALLRALAAGERPLLLAAGAAGEPWLRTLVGGLGEDLLLLLGPAAAPAPVEELRLGELGLVRERLQAEVGLLDPTDGGSAFALLVPALAAAQGACLVEKRLVLDRTRRVPEGAAALSPEEFHRMVELLRQAERARGEPMASRQAGLADGRRSVVAACLIPRGEVLTLDRLSFKRAADRGFRGLSPAEVERVIGRRAARPIQADETIREDMLQ
ncbi:MAG TPA: N-acetylneuraminate synthase family protein [Vicinamibacteria bacterium]|nr:N-acetylneuraminate synthase family protein [Vicinamibacteria bacterium]